MKKGKNEEFGLAMDTRPDPSATPNLFAPVKPLSFSNLQSCALTTELQLQPGFFLLDKCHVTFIITIQLCKVG